MNVRLNNNTFPACFVLSGVRKSKRWEVAPSTTVTALRLLKWSGSSWTRRTGSVKQVSTKLTCFWVQNIIFFTLLRPGTRVPGHHLPAAAGPRQLSKADWQAHSLDLVDGAHQDLHRGRHRSSCPPPTCHLPHLQPKSAGEHLGCDDGNA